MNSRINHTGIIAAIILCVWMTAAMVLTEPLFAQEKADAGRARCPLAYGGSEQYAPGERLDIAMEEISRKLYQKQAEMIALMAAPEVDEAAARALQKEINDLSVQQADRMLEGALRYKKENPNWQPRFWGGFCGRSCGKFRGCGFRGSDRQ